MGAVDGKAVPSANAVMGESKWLSWEGAEMVKYACNYWHSVKVCFANEIGRASKHAGVDGQELMRLLCEDTRLNISTYYMRPGNPFGGSCLPKDVSALRSYAAQHGLVLPLLDAVKPSNAAHADRLKDLVVNLGGQRVLIVGVAFKENTDDLRQSPMVALAESLLSEGFEVQLYDPKIKPAALVGANRTQVSRRLPSLESLLQEDLQCAFAQAETIVVLHPAVPIAELRALVRTDQQLVDVNGWPDLQTLPSRYIGFCW
jgi:GDP-mannose 6-dehydrogenase